MKERNLVLCPVLYSNYCLHSTSKSLQSRNELHLFLSSCKQNLIDLYNIIYLSVVLRSSAFRCQLGGLQKHKLRHIQTPKRSSTIKTSSKLGNRAISHKNQYQVKKILECEVSLEMNLLLQIRTIQGNSKEMSFNSIQFL